MLRRRYEILLPLKHNDGRPVSDDALNQDPGRPGRAIRRYFRSATVDSGHLGCTRVSVMKIRRFG